MTTVALVFSLLVIACWTALLIRWLVTEPQRRHTQALDAVIERARRREESR